MRQRRYEYDSGDIRGALEATLGPSIYHIGAYYGGMRTGAANDTCEDKRRERTQNGVEVYTFDNNSTTKN
jgi:hypothetical protein